MLSVRELECLVVLADELSFTRAASRLQVSQPTLSQMVKGIEQNLGFRVVDRTTRSSRLTPAGDVLVEGARGLLADLRHIEDTSRDVAEGRTAQLELGSVNPALRLLVPRLLRRVREKHPSLRVTLHPLDTHTQLRLLADGQLDVGILRAPTPPPGLDSAVLLHEPLYAVLGAEHPLASRESVSLASLDQATFVMASRGRNPYFYDELISLYRLHECSPARIIEADDMYAQLALVSAGFGVSVQPLLFVDPHRSDVVFVPVEEHLSLPLVIMWRKNAMSRILRFTCSAAQAEAAAILAELQAV